MNDLYIGMGYALFSAISYALYAVSLKPFKQRIILFFWVNLFVYCTYLTLYFFKTFLLKQQPHPIHNLLFEFTFTNIPFYLLTAFFWVGSLVIINYLLEKFEVSLVMPITEMSILFALTGYLLLGAKFSWISFTSILIVFVGAILSAYDTISWKDPFGPLKRIPKSLLIGGIIQALLNSGTDWITFICTHKTAQTLNLHNWINNMFLHIYRLPFSFHNPFYYNVGVRFFIAIVFILYVTLIDKNHKNIFTVLHNHFWHIITVSCFFSASVIAYHTAFFMLEDKNVLTALTKFSIPMILMIGYFYLKEEITTPKIVGCTVIVGGGLLSLLA